MNEDREAARRGKFMSSEEIKCLRCEGEMEEGEFETYMHFYGLKWWNGKYMSKLRKFFNNPEKTYHVKALRCKSCGKLELYAKGDYQ